MKRRLAPRVVAMAAVAWLALWPPVPSSASLPNDECSSATEIQTLPFVDSPPLSQADLNPPGDPLICGYYPNDFVRSVWYRFVPAADGTLCMDVPFFTALDTFTGDCAHLVAASIDCTDVATVQANVPLLIRLSNEGFNATGFQIVDGAADTDADGTPDCADSCPNEPGSSQSPCYCAPAGCPGDCSDDDHDSVPACADRCPLGRDDLDADRDLVPDACDNCWLAYNTDQTDTDGDGRGDACQSGGDVYALLTTLRGPSAAPGDRFGYALAPSNDGSVVVGAPFADVSGVHNAGAAYVFGNSPLPTTLIKSTPTAGDRLGTSVATLSDVAVIGAPFDDLPLEDAGAVYVNLVGLAPAPYPSPAAHAETGFSLAAGGAGAGFYQDTVVAGAPGHDADGTDAGLAYIAFIGFTVPPTVDTQAVHSPTPSPGAQFGVAVAVLTDGRIAVGAPSDDGTGAVYLFDRNRHFVTALHSPSPASGDLFGSAIAGLTGGYILVGAPFDDAKGVDAGAAYVFRPDGTFVGQVTSPEPAPGDHFGFALAGTGSFAVIGAPEAKVGAVEAGVAYLLDTVEGSPTFGTTLQRFANPTPAAGDRFGAAIAAVGGDPLADVVIGAPEDDADGPDAGIAYRFRFCSFGPCPQGCGNGMLDDDEECDDGNAVDGDGCDTNCTVTRCGNGITTAGEACDDGGLDDNDGCSSACLRESCGATIAATQRTPAATLADGCVSSCSCAEDTGKCCDDGDPCTTDDTCFVGFCQGTRVSCDDHVDCTLDSCNPATGACRHEPSDTACDDGIACTLDYCDPTADCQNPEIPDCCHSAAECDDGDPCNGQERCDDCVGCRYHDSPCCARGATCAKRTPLADGTACDDHDVCTDPDACQAGKCTKAGDVSCTGDDPCKIYRCDGPTVGCTFDFQPHCDPCATANDCRDDNACNGEERCENGYCSSGAALDCDDGDACTDDSCDRAQGCLHVASANATVRCLLAQAIEDSACASLLIPSKVTQLFDGAASSIESGLATSGKARKALFRKARNRLGHARKLVTHPSKKISKACRKVLVAAIAEARRRAK